MAIVGEEGLWEHGISHQPLTVPLLLRVRGNPFLPHRHLVRGAFWALDQSSLRSKSLVQ